MVFKIISTLTGDISTACPSFTRLRTTIREGRVIIVVWPLIKTCLRQMFISPNISETWTTQVGEDNELNDKSIFSAPTDTWPFMLSIQLLIIHSLLCFQFSYNLLNDRMWVSECVGREINPKNAKWSPDLDKNKLIMTIVSLTFRHLFNTSSLLGN